MNEAQNFLLNNECDDLRLKDALKVEDWIYTSDIMERYHQDKLKNHGVIGDVIARFSDEQIDTLIRELDEYARDYNHYEYGLPMHDNNLDNMSNIIKVKLNGL
jgi:hypothetical protein